ncbi:MAG: hypothetical protein L3K07_09315 [Thermoplasmata archaeon]|nr:hypothetical protein [Thermoplasmata archaeon]
MMGSSRIADLEVRATEAVNLWDSHVGNCYDCLAQGNSLCAEGVYLTQDVVQRRSAFEAHQNRMLLAGGASKRSLLRGRAVAA